MRSSGSSEAALRALHKAMRACRRCLEAGFSVEPGAVVAGPVSARVMVVGQAPGVTESDTGRPFNGASGQRLFEWLAVSGWDEATFRTEQYMTAITKCYPGKSTNGKGDRVPTRSEQALCAPFLQRELELVQPEVIVPVGSLAVQHFLGRVRLTDVVGNVAKEDGRRIVPLPHPSGVNIWLNRPANQRRVAKALDRLGQLREEQGSESSR